MTARTILRSREARDLDFDTAAHIDVSDFDANPDLTNGCEIGGVPPQPCETFTPHGLENGIFGQVWEASMVRNVSSGSVEAGLGDDVICNNTFSSLSYDLGAIPTGNFACWSTSAPIPEPSTALLLGLTGLAGKGRRRNRS